ncbi:ribosome small subunit-dependent GTPase A [Synechococcus sp. CS-1325]|uniref:ribosome small subunit-dependent GTPase A n=1 Tax=unclassified Synechococcus TaxID=2626047 RepID=UPI000DB66315|nr:MULTISPECIES: ribosome small subunit-dependent GTPase A [unclassified Synechococcus]MCT0199160.1 ribosome small subunit-dependent GTPase A [Synechococcus sp. CS-1325]MCT0214661.1 ribosome small subunit-dependent GTPase A [Synechococcus sp. CS-1326]MCT0233995.1 ribosome small subunit-dependent GTPase A [Synechococcus sp. CS-1327]PZU96586.1 MAG: ribosome small subunit-dependent GTPase A [Cyanobium sp.]
MATEPVVSGLVVALQANFCQVQLDLPGPGGLERLLCVRRSRLGKSGQQVCVGDSVELDGLDWVARRGAIVALKPRSSLLGRPAVANCNRVVVMVALAEPDLDPLQLTRFLLTAEATAQAVELVFSKADLLPGEAVQGWLRRVEAWGYQPLAFSLTTGEGLTEIRQRLCKPGLAVLCGPSGVGKSSLLNALAPALALRVGRVSGKLRRGRHTTRHVELFSLAAGALLADTPGFNRPEIPADPNRLAALFPEVVGRLALGPCRYTNCLHQGDPGCAVGTDWDRYPAYRQCLQELLDPGPAVPERRQPKRDARLRETSRRSRRQQEQDQGESLRFTPRGPADSGHR